MFYTGQGPFQTLIITDGVTTVNLLNSLSGFYCQSWTPAVTEPKDGGVYADSPLSHGRSLVSYKFGNVSDTFLLTVHNETPNDLIRDTQNIRRLLLKALNKGLVWIEDQAVGEDNQRFMQVVNYRATTDGNPHGTDTFWTKLCSAAFPEWPLEIERKPFCFGNPPGVGQCSKLSAMQEGWFFEGRWTLNTAQPVGNVNAMFLTSGGVMLAGETAQVWRTSTGGAVWTASAAPPAGTVYSFCEVGGFVYAHTTAGVYRSADNSNWLPAQSLAFVSSTLFSITAFGTDLYGIGTQAGLTGVFKSTDGGATWGAAPVLAIGSVGAGVGSVFALRDGSALLATGGNASAGNLVSIFRSTNGTAWQAVYTSATLGAFISSLYQNDDYMFLHETNALNLTANILRSSDGINWGFVGPQINHRIDGITGYLGDSILCVGVGAAAAGYATVISYDGTGRSPTQQLTLTGLASAVYFPLLGKPYAGEVGNIITLLSGDSIDLGRSATCLDEVFVANNQCEANGTHAYTFDAAPVTWTARPPNGATPYNIYPTTPAVGDISYYGMSTPVIPSGPIDNVVFDLTRAMTATSWTIVKEYWTGAAWATLATYDGTGSFQVAGVNPVSWRTPTNFGVANLLTLFGGTAPDVSAFWVRWRITAITGATATSSPQQGNRALYTANWNHFHVAADQVPGDFQALARLVFNCRGDADGPRGAEPDGWASRFLVAVKPIGEDGVGSSFVSLLNCADEQNPTGVSATAGVGTVFTDDMEAPSGRRMTHTTTGVSQWQDVCTFTIGPSFAVNYYGKHRCIVRAQQVNRTSVQGEVLVRVLIRTGSGGIETVSRFSQFPNLNPWQVLDFQQAAIPASELFTNADIADQTQVVIQVWSSVAAKTVYLYDLGLFPVDWCFADVEDVAFRDESVVENGYNFDLDSVTDPMHEVRAFVRASGSNFARSIYNPVCSAPISLEPNADQSVHVLAMRGEVTGTHTGANNAATLTDSAASFLTSNVKVGQTIWNQTDGSSAVITGVTATTITGTLSGGAENDWDTADAYTIICPNWRSVPWGLFSVTGQINPRYFSMRGNR